MSAPDPDDDQVAVPPAAGHGPVRSAPVPEPVALPPARRPWSAWSEMRGDLRSASAVVAVLAISGFPVGLLWWALAPRAHLRITADGATVIGNPPEELRAADDAVFALLLVGLGLLAGALAWWLLRRRRGVAMLVALVLGTTAAAVIAWRLGQLLGPAPTAAALKDVGARITTELALNSLPALAMGPFCAVLVYLSAAVFTQRDDLGRTHLPAPVAPAEPTFPEPFDAPAGRPQG